jgi:hypothetical protein
VQAVHLHLEAGQVAVAGEAAELAAEGELYKPVEGVEALDKPVADTAEAALNIPVEQALVVAAPAEERAAFVGVVPADTAVVVLPKIDPNLFAARQFSFAGKSAAAERMQDFVSDHCLDIAELLADWAAHSCRFAPDGKFGDRSVDCLRSCWQGLAVVAAHTAVVVCKALPAASPEHSEQQEEEVVVVARQPRELGSVGHKPAVAVRLVQGQAQRRSGLLEPVADLARHQDEQFSALNGPGCLPW